MFSLFNDPIIRVLSAVVHFLPVLSCLAITSTMLFGQELPRTIRGYKVHREVVSIGSSGRDSEDPRGLVRFGDPFVTDVSVSGVTLKLPVEFVSKEQSGRVDFLMFHDVEVNGIPVTVEEYDAKFEFRRNRTVNLPDPASIFLPTTRIVQAAWYEMRDSKKEWIIRGRVFVFGKFRKYGLHHKRAVPLDFTFTVNNPLYKN